MFATDHLLDDRSSASILTPRCSHPPESPSPSRAQFRKFVEDIQVGSAISRADLDNIFVASNQVPSMDLT